MPYSRFANVSKWRNAQATQAKPDQRYQELGLDLTSDSSSLLKVSSHWVIAKASSAGKLILLPNDQESTKKYAKQPPTFHTAPSNITDFDLSPFESQPDYHLASATSTGSISVHSLPYPSSTSPIVAEVPVHLSSFASPGSKPVSCLAYHPTSSGLLLSSAIDQIDLWDYNHQLSSPSTSLSAQAPVLSTAWSLDGRLTGATCKDGTLKIFDARSGPDPTASFQSHLSKLKPSRLAFVRSLLLSTGFSAMREREWAVWDPRALKSPLKRGTVDTSTGTLVPLVDQDRGLVFLSGRGDSNIRWIEVDDSTSFTEGQFPLGLSQIGAGIGPSSALRVMQGEIDRLYLATNEDSIVPVSITIPRRQYIDFHQDLYPPTSSQIPAQDSAAWLSGRDAQLKLVSQDPLKSKVERDEARSSAACLLRSESSRQGEPAGTGRETDLAKAQAKEERQDAQKATSSSKFPQLVQAVPEAAKENPTAPAYDLAKSLPRPDEHVDQPAKPSTADKPSQPLSTTDQVQTQHTAVPRPFKTGTAAPPPWSRRFLAGNTPLQAAYQNLTNIDVGMAPDSRMIVANSKYLLFPLAGPGGRLGVHPVSELGRMPTLIPCFSAPSKLVDFAVDPFDERRVVTAHDDGSLRVWILPENGGPLPAQNVSEPDIVMNSNYAGKISEIAFHPTTRNIVGSSSPEEDGKLLIWDLESGKQALSIPTLGAGSSSLSWSPDGGMVALAGRDKTLRVVAPVGGGPRRSDGDIHATKEIPSSSSTESIIRFSEEFLADSIAFGGEPGVKPHITLTFAQSADGKIAGEGKKQIALSCRESMLMTHKLRTLHDGILIGIGTLTNDNPQLNARLLPSPPPLALLPRPIVLDSDLRTPVECKLLLNYQAGIGQKPIIICRGSDIGAEMDERRRLLRENGADVLQVQMDPTSSSHLPWTSVLEALSCAGIKRLMVEGGACVIDSLLATPYVDTLLITSSPKVIGPGGLGYNSSSPLLASGDGGCEMEGIRKKSKAKFGLDEVIVSNKATSDPDSPTRAGKDSASNVKSGSILLSNLKNFKLVWLSEKDLILVGHAMGSARQIKLMGISSSAGSEISIIEKATLNLDVSPAILFPHWDEDTQILWLFSKGERSISAFEIHPEEKDPFTPLPAFQHSQPQLGFAFLDKKHVDPRKVEIAVSFRLCKGEIQRVSWCIPRLRLEYFQDDIFVPTRDVSKPLREAKDWLDGNLTCTEPVYLDLCPEGMKNLSDAPAVKSKSTLPKGPIKRELTEEERQEQLLSGIFRKAKDRGRSDVSGHVDQDEDDEPQVGAAAKRAPDNDDWSD